MINYKLYIGSDNTTGKCNFNLIRKILTKHFSGYTMQTSSGSWNGRPEETAIVEITTENKTELLELIAELKTELDQESIGAVETPAILFY